MVHSFTDCFTRSLAVGLLVLAIPSVVGASLQLRVEFTEQETANSGGDAMADLFSLTLNGTGSGVSITSITFTTPNDVFFDTVFGDLGSGNAWGFAVGPENLSGTPTISPANNVLDGQKTLTLDFSGAGFGQSGDMFTFMIDVDDNNNTVRGFDPNNFAPSMNGTMIDVVYDAGSLTGLTSSFVLNTPEGAEVPFSNADGSFPWYQSISGSVQLVPEASSVLVWLLLGCCGMVVSRRLQGR